MMILKFWICPTFPGFNDFNPFGGFGGMTRQLSRYDAVLTAAEALALSSSQTMSLTATANTQKCPSEYDANNPGAGPED